MSTNANSANNLNVDTLVKLLTAGNVTVTTSNLDGPPSGGGNLTISAGVTWTAATHAHPARPEQPQHHKEGNPNACAYSASKAGVISLTKSLGKELATAGVCVNCITPAVIQTEMLKQSTKEHIAYMVSKIPMGRLGHVDEVAALVCWLASAECSFSTGAVFDISGGRATY